MTARVCDRSSPKLSHGAEREKKSSEHFFFSLSLFVRAGLAGPKFMRLVTVGTPAPGRRRLGPNGGGERRARKTYFMCRRGDRWSAHSSTYTAAGAGAAALRRRNLQPPHPFKTRAISMPVKKEKRKKTLVRYPAVVLPPADTKRTKGKLYSGRRVDIHFATS